MSVELLRAAHTAKWMAGTASWSAKHHGHVGPEVMNDLIEAVRDLAVVNDRITDEGRVVTTEQRVQALEATAYRSAGEFAEIRQAVAHLTGAIGELSQGQRGIAQDVREIAQSLDLVEHHISEQGQILREQGQMLRAIVVHLGLNPDQ